MHAAVRVCVRCGWTLFHRISSTKKHSVYTVQAKSERVEKKDKKLLFKKVALLSSVVIETARGDALSHILAV